MTKFADQLRDLLTKRIKEDPFDVVESLIGLSATMMADDSSLDLEHAAEICLSIFKHGWNARRRAFLPSDKSVH